MPGIRFQPETEICFRLVYIIFLTASVFKDSYSLFCPYFHSWRRSSGDHIAVGLCLFEVQMEKGA